MTKASTLRTRVLTLDATGMTAAQIAATVGIPVARVDRILDDQDPPHDLPEAPAIEPLERTPKTKGTSLKVRPKPKPKPKASRKMTPASDIRCGTVPGYYRHRRLKEPTCQPCRDAYIADARIKRPRKRPPIECGTYRGYKKHRRAGETPCRPCYDAYNESCRKWKAAQRDGKPPSPGRPRQPINHGTPAGYRTHNRRNEPPCDECRLAYNESRRRERETA